MKKRLLSLLAALSLSFGWVGAAELLEAAIPLFTESDFMFVLGFLQDWAGPLFDSDSGGWANLYWDSQAEPSARFGWAGTYGSLAAFETTPGEQGGRYLTTVQRDRLLSMAGLPLGPEPH